MRFGNFFKNPLGIAVKIIIKIYPFIICPISSCHGSRRVKRLFDFTTFLPACELACQYSLYSCGGTLPNRVRTERIIVTSHCHGGKISGSQQSALTKTAGRNVWGTVLFLSAILHRKVIHVKYFRFFFSAILAGLRLLLRSRNFATPKQPHHPTTTTPTLHAAVCIPVHARSDIKVHILQNVPFAFAVVQKMRDLLILTDILHIANVFFRLQWYFCLFLGCFWESSSTVLSSYNV